MHASNSTPPAGWVPDTPPELHGERLIRLDFETDGLQWWDRDRPVGVAYFLPSSGRRGYLAWGHKGGGNGIDEETARRWMRQELRGVHIDNANTKFDIHMSRAFGVDWVDCGCTFGDVQHRSALLDDHRFRNGLDQLAKDFLGVDQGKLELELKDKGNLHRLPAWAVAPYAVHDVELVDELVKIMDPMIREQDLQQVLKLEQDIIPVVVEMEKNGAYLDMDLLAQWQTAANLEYQSLLMSISRAAGFHVDSPDSARHLTRLFKALNIPFTTFTGSMDKHGNPKPSFTGEVLRAIDHPVIKQVLRAAQLGDLKSKYLDKYAQTVRADGWIRFNLHQLRVGRDENDKYGTVSGRFSSAGDEHGGFNVQQVVSPDKQKVTKENPTGWCPEFIIRNLFVPEKGRTWLSVDASQIEYRIFAHYANAPDIIARYNAEPPYETLEIEGHEYFISGPRTDYHAIVQVMLRRAKPNIRRKKTKITNFCKLFGSGLIKFALTLGTITEQVFEDLTAKYAPGRWANDRRGRYRAMEAEPALAEALSVVQAYDEMFPAAKEMLQLAATTAKDRGYVKTWSGRRARFPGGNRKHSALNRAVQGTAADINKLMLIDAYRNRRTLGITAMRMTVHDEMDCDTDSPERCQQIEDFCNQQRVPLRVPILWDASVGPSWGQAKGKA